MAARKRARKATRKKTTAKAGRKKATRKKAAKKTTRKKAGRKATGKKAPRKATRKKAGRGAAPKKATRKTPARKAPARRASASPSPLVALAKKIVDAGQSDGSIPLEQLYAADCISYESGNPEPARGLDGLRQKMEMWSQMQEGTEFKPLSVNFGKDTIAIEWEGKVKLRGGPTVTLSEVAIHRIKGGKIAEERYYYDPSAFGGGSGGSEAAPPPAPEPRYTPSPMADDDEDDGDGDDGYDL